MAISVKYVKGLAVEKPTLDHIEASGEESSALRHRERKLLRRIDLYVLPWLCIAYSLSLIDRGNIAAAKVAGMQTDLNLYGNRYSVALLIFFISYIITEIPSNAILGKVGTRAYLSILITCWGIVAMCFGFVQNFAQLSVLRFLLGMFEGGFNPACVYVISCWYRRHELQQRISIWFVTGSVVSGFTGVTSYALSLMDGAGGFAGWRWIFIVPGALTIATAIPIYFFVADFPENATWLTGEQRQIMRSRLTDDRQGVEEEGSVRQGLVQALTDWKIYAISFLLMFSTAGSYSLAFFTPTILGTFGFSTAMSQILTTPPYILAAIISVGTGMVADKVKMRSPFIFGHSILVIIGLVLVGWGNNTAARLIGVFLAVTGNNCAIPATMAMLANNAATSKKRQFAVPIQTIFGGIGGVIGSLIFRQQDYPGYRPGLYASFGCMGLNMLLSVSLGFYFHLKNKRADQDGVVLEGIPGFRYTI